MSTRKLLVLTAVFAALLAFVVFYERLQPTQEERNKAKKRLLDVKAEDVTALVVERPDLPKVVLTKKGDKRWFLAGPPAFPADTTTIETILADLGRLDLEGDARTAFDAKETGLDAPKAKATLTFKDGSTKTVLFGKAVPGTEATAASEGGRFGAVRFAPMAALSKPVDEFRSKALLEVPVAEITELTIARGAQKIVIARSAGEKETPAGPWRVEAPVRDLASQTFADQLLSDVMAVRVSEFADVPPIDLPKVGLAPPNAVLTLKKGADAVSTVAFGAAKADTAGKIYARRDEAVLVVDDRLQEDLGKELTAFREPKLLPVESWTVARISFDSPSLRVGAEKVDGSWRSAGKGIPSNAAEDLVDRIARAEVRGFVSAREYAARGIPFPKGREKTVPALATVEVWRDKETTPRSVRFLPAAPSGAVELVAAEVSGRSEAVLVEKTTLTDLQALAATLRKAASATPTPAPKKAKGAAPDAPPAAAPAPASAAAPSSAK